MAVTKNQVLEQLRRVKGPDMEGNLVDLGLISEVLLKDDRVYFSITVPAERAQELEPLRQAAEKVVKDIPSVTGVTAVLTAEKQAGRPTASAAAPRGQAPESTRVAEARARTSGGGSTGQRPAAPPQAGGGRQAAAGVPGIKHMIAVASGKGGVGKSTTAVNLALGFKAIGLKAGILDADIYGPSQPRLRGLSGRPEVVQGKTLKAMEGHGLKAMSMGFMIDEGTPIIWRGPMVVSALTQMLRDVMWGELDVLVIDMPPGTGDVQLTMAQQVPLAGAIIVSTPQDLALIDARKGLNMFRKVDIPVLGIIENMSYFVCPKCNERSDIFGHGGAHEEADKLGVTFLGEVPLHIDIRTTSDAGKPIVASQPDGLHAMIYRDIAKRAWAELDASLGTRTKPPALQVSEGKDELRVTTEGASPIVLSAEMLRVMSPSAEVQGHSPDQRVTLGRKRNVRINDLRPIGNYAIKIVFSDGHDTGLYTWDYLQLLGREKEQRWSEYLKELEAKGLSRD
jgi:ATP-binding protein involved in chromosome partitioning